VADRAGCRAKSSRSSGAGGYEILPYPDARLPGSVPVGTIRVKDSLRGRGASPRALVQRKHQCRGDVHKRSGHLWNLARRFRPRVCGSVGLFTGGLWITWSRWRRVRGSACWRLSRMHLVSSPVRPDSIQARMPTHRRRGIQWPRRR
jgi:hypothetical protein